MMALIQVNFKDTLGKIKPMHATNNGPMGKVGGYNSSWTVTEERHDRHIVGENIYEFAMAGIPYARTHDSSFLASYGLEHTIDVAAIFPILMPIPMTPTATISPAPTTIWI